MKYKFRKQSYSGDQPLYQYGVEVLDNSIRALEQIEWWGWTSDEVQMIIDKSMALKDNEEFEYQVEGSDFIMSIDKDEVYFYDLHNPQKEEDFKWPLSEFITFMKEFKKFIEENS
jgi:hypothetical protein